MTKAFFSLLACYFLIGCSFNKNKKVVNPSAKNDYVKADSVTFPKLDIRDWSATPAINGRVATEEDVKKGLAIFYINAKGGVHTPYSIQLPALAYLTDFETKKESLVIVIQIESTSSGIVAGYRNIDGGSGACLLHELRFLSESEAKNLTGL